MANDSRKDERDRAAHPSQSIISNDNKGGSALRGTDGGGGAVSNRRVYSYVFVCTEATSGGLFLSPPSTISNS